MSKIYISYDVFYVNNIIGTGSFSNIYKGYSSNLNKEVAIKKIKLTSLKEIDESSQNEISIMKSIDHMNILKLFDSINSNNNLFLIIEYCDDNLRNYINSSNIYYNYKYLLQIIEGLIHLNSIHIIHRDIKPENILINHNTIKISDFGLSKMFHKAQLFNTICGSPLYMAPEIEQTGTYTNNSDIWSLGVVLYELLSKNHPYVCNSKEELFLKFKTKKYNINFNIIPDFYRNYIQNMIVVDSYKRMNWVQLNQFLVHIKNENHEHLSDVYHYTQYHTNNRSQSISIPVSKIHSSLSQTSSSAPKNLEKSYIENYFHHQTNQIETNIPILGISPNKNDSTNNILNKSINTLKGFLH